MSVVINNILERITIFHICNYQFVVFGAKTLEIIFISAYQANEQLLQMLSMSFLPHFLILCI